MKRKKTSDYFWSLALSVAIIFIVYRFGYASLNNYLVDDKAINIKALVINEENVYPNQNVAPFKFSYSYEFEVDGKKYKGDSHDSALKVGDTVGVKYYKYCPCFNKSVHPKD